MIFQANRISLTLWSSLSVFLLLSATQAQEHHITGKHQTIAENSASSIEPIEKPGEGKREITFVDGKLSVNLKNAEMDGVLAEIGTAVKARVDIGAGIPAKTSVSFSNLSLEDGLAALIKGEGAGIVLCYDKNGALTLIKLSKKTGAGPELVFKVKKVRSYFSPQDQASGLSMNKVKELMSILRDPNKKGRWVIAAKQIMNIKNPEAKPYLKELITHEDDFVREEAAWEYAMLVDAEDADYILDLAEDKAWQNRNAAAEIAMPMIDDPRQIPMLIKMLQDRNIAVQDSAISALGNKRAQAAVPYLEDLLKTANGGTRAAVAEALYSITKVKYEWKTPKEKADFEEILRKSDEEIKRKTAEYEKQAQ